MSQSFPCPLCRAVNEQGPNCRRCKADLSSLFQLVDERDRVLSAACREALGGRPDRMLALVLGAEAMRGGGDARRLRAVAHLLRRDFRQALETAQTLSEDSFR